MNAHEHAETVRLRNRLIVSMDGTRAAAERAISHISRLNRQGALSRDEAALLIDQIASILIDNNAAMAHRAVEGLVPTGTGVMPL